MKKELIDIHQLDNMLHALGYPRMDKHWKASTILEKAYRNRYVTYVKDYSWEDLIIKGFAKVETQKNCDHSDLYFYYVTEKGIDEIRKVKK